MVNLNNLTRLLDTSPLHTWKETLALLCLFAERDEWPWFFYSLDSKLLASGNQLAPTLCYKHAMNMERAGELWSCNGSDEQHLWGFVETAVGFALTTQQKRFISSLCKLLEVDAEIWANDELLLSTSMEYSWKDALPDQRTSSRNAIWFELPVSISFNLRAKRVSFPSRKSSSAGWGPKGGVLQGDMQSIKEDSLVSHSFQFEVAVGYGKRLEDGRDVWDFFLEAILKNVRISRTKNHGCCGFPIPNEAKVIVHHDLWQQVTLLDQEDDGALKLSNAQAEAAVFSYCNGEEFFQYLLRAKADNAVSDLGIDIIINAFPNGQSNQVEPYGLGKCFDYSASDDDVPCISIVEGYKWGSRLCIFANRMGNGRVVALVGLSWDEITCDQCLEMNYLPLKGVPTIVIHDSVTLVNAMLLRLWKPALPLLCIFAGRQKFTLLDDYLPSKLLVPGNTSAATICCFAGNSDKVVEVQSSSAKQKLHVNCLQGSKGKTMLFASQKRIYSSLFKVIGKYFEMSAKGGLMSKAMEYLKLSVENLSAMFVLSRDQIAVSAKEVLYRTLQLEKQQTAEPENQLNRNISPVLDVSGMIQQDDYLKAYFVEDTCYSMDFLGLSPQDNNDSVASDIKVGIIEYSTVVTNFLKEQDILGRPVTSITIHKERRCKELTRLSNHGILCASILAGKSVEADFYNICGGKVRGVFPACQLYGYGICCPSCSEPKDDCQDHTEEAFKCAVKDGVHIISMSLGISDLRAKTIAEDDIGGITFKAFQKGILCCVPAGNRGPSRRTLNYGMPWCLNVGACTSNKILVTELSVAVKQDMLALALAPAPAQAQGDYEILETVSVNDDVFAIVQKIEGISFNVFEDDKYYPFEMTSISKNKDSVVFYEDERIKLSTGLLSKMKHATQMNIANYPLVTVRREDTNLLWKWLQRLKSKMYVRISRSKFIDDERGVYIPDFSSRGPSVTYPQLIMPDVVAPGYAIVAAWPPNVPITSKDAIRPLLATQNIKSGTSFANPHVAGAAAYLKHYHPEWSAFAIKSALITTARSLAGTGIPGDEFSYGAGIIQPCKAMDPGLLFDETAERFQLYRKGKLIVENVNMPSFAASFAASHRGELRILRRTVTYIGENPVTYLAEINIFTNTLDPNVVIEVQPNELQFSTRGQQESFSLRVTVLARPQGHVSAALKWVAKGCNDVISPIHLYQEGRFDARLIEEGRCDARFMEDAKDS